MLCYVMLRYVMLCYAMLCYIYAAAPRSQMRLGLAYWFTGHEKNFIDDVGSTSAKARSTDVVSIQTNAGMVL